MCLISSYFKRCCRIGPQPEVWLLGGVIAAQIGSREHGAQRIDGVHAAPFHAPQPLL